jgi:hypothetical protein
MTGLIVLDPTAQPVSARAELAPRLTDLNGRTVGFLDNGKPNSGRFLELLGGSTTVAATVVRRKPSIGRLAPPGLIDELAGRCDLVVTGVGDCAGCCSCTAQDGIALERRGVMTYVVCTTEFFTTARIAATTAGIPDYPFVVVDHPLGSLSAEQLAGRAAQARAQMPLFAHHG